MSRIYESGENYLETILILKNKGNSVRSVDIAREMQLSKPSVSRAMGILRNDGYISVDADGFITLTALGDEIAQRIYERHRVLTEWLVDIGVSPETASVDACKIEHDISHESFSRLKEHLRNKHNKKIE